MVPRVSVEIFPAEDAAGQAQLSATIAQLAPLRPQFVSVTCGADARGAERTMECVRQLVRDTPLEVVPHLTCVAAGRAELLARAAAYWRDGRRQLVALRGDRPTGGSLPAFAHASELVAALCAMAPFRLSVAAYPEGHPDSGSVEADVENLARKEAAGACRAITQFCFDTAAILRYRDRCAAAGIALPVVPGVLPVLSLPQLRRFAARCGATVPAWMASRFEAAADDAAAVQRVAARILVDQVVDLHREGIEEFHFYTLNRAELTLEACAALGYG